MLLGLLRQYVRPYRWLFATVALLQLISTLASLYLPTLNAAIIDDGVAKGDTATIIRLGGVMLAVTGLQVVCSVGAVYFGSRTGMGFGRDLRSAIFQPRHGFSAREAARFGAPSLLTRTTNDVRQIQVLVQMTCTVLITAPIMCDRRHLHGGAPERRPVVAAAGQRAGAGRRQLLDRVAPAADLPRPASG